MADPDDLSRAAWGLVDAAKTGDRDAFGELWRLYQPQVFRYVLFRLGDRVLADDITAEAFLKAWRSLHTCTYRGRDVGAWFVTIARNTLMDHLKAAARRELIPISPLGAADCELEPAPAAGPDALVPDQHERAAVSVRLEREMSRLSAQDRAALRRRHYDGMTGAQGAADLGITEAAYKASLVRAHKRLRQMAALHGQTSSAQYSAAS